MSSLISLNAVFHLENLPILLLFYIAINLLITFSSIVHILAKFMLFTSSNLLQVFATVYEYLSILLYTLLKETKRMHLIIPELLRYLIVKRLPHAYRYFYALITLYYKLHMQWLMYKTLYQVVILKAVLIRT